ncbi:hypothetical protein [Saccharomonospora azurea]|nr:hypothetical protein [Saccharomonospora azurea]
MTPPTDHDQADELAPPLLAASFGERGWQHLLNARPVEQGDVPADDPDRE